MSIKANRERFLDGESFKYYGDERICTAKDTNDMDKMHVEIGNNTIPIVELNQDYIILSFGGSQFIILDFSKMNFDYE